MRIALKTLTLTALLFMGFYPSEADMWEFAGYAGMTLGGLSFYTWVTWRLEFSHLPFIPGIRASLQSWGRPDSLPLPSGKRPNRRRLAA